MWRPYTPVRERISKAKKKMAKLAKKGLVIQPVKVRSRAITKEFWGVRWCKHLENHCDYSNRLSRGRTYVRNGSVVHLETHKGCVVAYVAGSSTYQVEVAIRALAENKWEKIKNQCRSSVGSLLEILTGQLSEQVLQVLTDPEKGLFPSVNEIEMQCTCPDWADMCKHIAAVLYGVASRLDEQPDLLFLLRGVDAQELLDTELSFDGTTSENAIQDDDLSALFGIEFEDTPTAPKRESKTRKVSKNLDPHTWTGAQIKSIREKRAMSVSAFAQAIGVTPASIYRWEKQSAKLTLRSSSKDALCALMSN